jgi:predicted GIY-YIG superfamily endonuclease
MEVVNKSSAEKNSAETLLPETTNGASKYAVWVRLNHKGIYHDNRRLLKHRAKNCECFVCYREIYKLPPAETHDEYVNAMKIKMKEREIKRAKRMVKKQVREGKQGTIDQFFG